MTFNHNDPDEEATRAAYEAALILGAFCLVGAGLIGLYKLAEFLL